MEDKGIEAAICPVQSEYCLVSTRAIKPVASRNLKISFISIHIYPSSQMNSLTVIIVVTIRIHTHL